MKQYKVNSRDFKKGDKMRKRLLSMCYQLGSPWSNYDGMLDKMMINKSHLNNWMLKSSYLHKSLNDYTYAELPKLITQFENLFKSYLKK